MSENTHAADQEVLSALLTDTKGIEIIPRYNESDISHPNCLVVTPYRDTEHDTALMANVEHYLERQDSTGFPWEITLLTEDPLRLKTAVDVAVRYAKENNVPVIFLNQDGFSTDDEKQQTGTTEILKLPKGNFS
jgi:hypothetical protein